MRTGRPVARADRPILDPPLGAHVADNYAEEWLRQRPPSGLDRHSAIVGFRASWDLVTVFSQIMQAASRDRPVGD